MRSKLINNQFHQVNQKKVYLYLVAIALSLFLILFFTQFSSLYVINSYASNSTSAADPPIYLAYFFEPGCRDCDKVKIILEDISQEYPDTLILKSFDITLPESIELAETLGELYQMPEEERLLVPVIFIGDDYLFRNDITYENLEELIEKYSTTETVAPWEKVQGKDLTARERLIARFQSFGLATVGISGFIDGLNPCSFATIIFFISYLTLINRKGRDILWVGGMFTLSVFLTYFLIGTGALKIVTSLSFLSLMRKIFYVVSTLIALILGIISLYDYIQFKVTGTGKDAKLKLSPFLKKMIRSTIRKNVKLSNYILMAAVTGFIVSLLELACTGQLYLPTIMFISSIPDLKVNALFYLLFYNLMFIIPLILVFSFTYWGTSSEQWISLTMKNYGKVKLATTLLFFGLAALLLYTGILYK
jgi:thiol-disulfide isomerase/thioredoxin